MDRQITEDTKLASFLSELSDVSLKYGIAITGSPVLFVMEPEDRAFAYRADEDSNLHWG